MAENNESYSDGQFRHMRSGNLDMNMRILVVIMVCLGLLLSLKLAGVFDTPVVEKPVIGAAAPDFTLYCVDGSTVTLSSLRGSKVIINFWNMFCPPCLEQMSFLQQIHEKYPSLPMLVVHEDWVHLPFNGMPFIIRGYLSNNKFNFTVPLITPGTVRALYNNWVIPKTYFLDPLGIVRRIQIGKFNNSDEIDHLLNSY